MAHGPDTEELMWRIAESKITEKLDVSYLNITSLPELWDDLKFIECWNTNLKYLPKLPSNLRGLYCGDTPLTQLPELPKTLVDLECHNTKLTILPDLPPKLEHLICRDIPTLKIQRNKKESINHYRKRWNEWKEEVAAKQRIVQRCKIVKEEFMQKFWNPDRVEILLEKYGWEIIDGM